MIDYTDIEIGLVLCFLVLAFTLGLRKHGYSQTSRFSGIDLQMSSALKGIACVLILLGHFVKLRNVFIDASPFTLLVYFTSSNVALTLFMYFSGYGLSLKKYNGGGFLNIWYKRLKKVYIPLLLTCIIAMLIYAILPVKFTLDECETLGVSKDIWYLHSFKPEYLKMLVPHLLGWKVWYVFCIIIFYSLFYLSQSLTRNNPENQTWVLWLMMVTYFVFAYFYFGELEAHWYRYCWIFFGGHVHGKMVQSGKINKWDLMMLLGLSITMIIEGKYMILSYVMAISIIGLCSLLNRRYIVSSRILAFMGTISYFFYLTHIKIGYTLLSYIGIYSILLWLVITIAISYGMYLLKTILSRNAEIYISR